MQFLNIHAPRFVEGYDIGCPISKSGEPADRGYPSLKGYMLIFICGLRWYRDSPTGCERRDLEMPWHVVRCIHCTDLTR